MARWRLVGGGVTVVDDLVLRPVRPWTGAVHALLTHLRARGLDCVPEPVGVRHDVEAVTFIPGDAGSDAFEHQHTIEGLESAARLLRRIHDATTDFEPPNGIEWAHPPVPGATTVCHGDPAPWNFVWRDGEAVGLIDWDHAHPAPVIDDVAYAVDTFAPVRPDDVAVRDHRFPTAPDRPSRVTAFAAAYDLGGTAGIVDRVIDRQQQTVERVLSLAERGLDPWAAWCREGYLEELRARPRWTRAHRHLLE